MIGDLLWPQKHYLQCFHRIFYDKPVEPWKKHRDSQVPGVITKYPWSERGLSVKKRLRCLPMARCYMSPRRLRSQRRGRRADDLRTLVPLDGEAAIDVGRENRPLPDYSLALPALARNCPRW
jgi:hypothetical protein